MRVNELGEITEGPPIIEWETPRFMKRYSERLRSDGKYYHMIQLIKTTKKSPPPDISEARESLLERKRAERYSAWLRDEVRKSVEILVPEYEDVLDRF